MFTKLRLDQIRSGVYRAQVRSDQIRSDQIRSGRVFTKLQSVVDVFHAEELRHDVENHEGVEGKLGRITRQRLTSFERLFKLLKQIDGDFLRQKRLTAE